MMDKHPMQVYYKTILDTDGVSINKAILLHNTVCCNMMAEAVNDSFIGFGHWRECMSNRDTSINITSVQLYPGDENFDFMPIALCPFCGAAIQITEAERVKLVERKQRRTEIVTDEVAV